MTEATIPKKFDQIFAVGTTPDQFPDIVKPFLTPEDIQALGGDSDLVAQKISDSIAYLGAFAPAPATFDKGAFMATAGFDYPAIEAERILSIAQRLGVIQSEPNERLSISQSMAVRLEGLLTEE